MTKKLTGLGLVVARTHAAKPQPPLPPIPLLPDLTGVSSSDILVLVGNAQGRLIGELDCTVAGVAWKLNDYGQARLRLANPSATATESLLRPGNRILIQFGNGLPDWGGAIDLPRKWQSGRIEVVAYSGERLLVDRITGPNRVFANVPAGQIFASLLNEATPSGITLGNVWYGEDLLSFDFHYRQLYDIFQNSLGSQAGNGDWNVSAQLVSGRIRFQCNFYSRRGVDHGRRVALLEGVNLADVSLQEQGPLVNEWFVAGSGSGWATDQRLYSYARDDASIPQFGLRQRGMIRVDIGDQETLDSSAEIALLISKDIHAILDPTALDLAPARYHQYDVGDYVWVELYETGFGTFNESVRVIAREYFPETNVCSLVVE